MAQGRWQDPDLDTDAFETGSDHSKPGWSPSNLDRYQRFYTTLLHGTNWNAGIKYFAICWLNFREDEQRLYSPMFENDPLKHAEEYLLDHLRLLLSVIDEDKVESVTIMQNSSPCARCSDLFVNEASLRRLVDRPDVTVTIVFSSLHWIRRPSCRWKNHSHADLIHVDDHDENLKGLKTLSSAGFEVRATKYRDWVELRTALQLPPTFSEESYTHRTDTGCRREEDEALAEDLENILNY